MRRGFGLRQSVSADLGWAASTAGDVMSGAGRTGALTSDYHGLQRCIRSEQQCNKHQTYYCKKGESWHCRVPTPHASALRVTVKSHYRDWSSWTVVQISDADGIDVYRECAESQAVREYVFEGRDKKIRWGTQVQEYD
jgi:hypothetical protein